MFDEMPKWNPWVLFAMIWLGFIDILLLHAMICHICAFVAVMCFHICLKEAFTSFLEAFAWSIVYVCLSPCFRLVIACVCIYLCGFDKVDHMLGFVVSVVSVVLVIAWFMHVHGLALVCEWYMYAWVFAWLCMEDSLVHRIEALDANCCALPT